MKNTLTSTLWDKLRKKSWYESLRLIIWQYPDRFMALKTTLSMGLLIVPCVLLGEAFMGVTLGLGALAGALAETDDHPKGRIKALMGIVISFAISSGSVELLRPYPILFGVGLVGSTIFFIIVGGLGERYRGITFGALLVAIYTMLGSKISPAPYWQPILLPMGALFYGLISLILLYLHPWRLLEEQLALCYEALARYMKTKARLFPSDAKEQENIRNRLSVRNIKVVTALEHCKNVINSYSDALKDDNLLRPYLHHFMLLQILHERAASSHQRYDLLSSERHNHDLMEGLGQLLFQLSHACSKMSQSLLTGHAYKHPVALNWTVTALHDQLKQHKETRQSPLALLLHNLTQSHMALQNLHFNIQSNLLPPLDRHKVSMKQRLLSQLSWSHPRMRYALRLSTCFIIGYTLITIMHLEKGDWVLLTSLFVCQPSYSETRKRLFQRIMGTLTGVIAGVLIVQLLPTIMGQLLLMLASAYAFFVWLRHNYANAVVFITIFVLCAFNLTANQGIAVMTPRIIDTLIGSILAMAVVRFMWPDWQYKRLPSLLDDALHKNGIYFQAILKEYKEPSENNLNYRRARQQAHQADNALALAWRGMKLEPKQQKRFQSVAFTLTYLNHALLSYLSALGAHRDSQQSIHPDSLTALELLSNTLTQTHELLTPEVQMRIKTQTEEILEQFNQKLNQLEKGTQRQKTVLLYNIAEVTGQLIRQSHLIEEITQKRG